MGKPMLRLMLIDTMYYLVSHRSPLVQLEESFAVLASISARTILYKWLNSEGLEEYFDSSLCKRKFRKTVSTHCQQENLTFFKTCCFKHACRICRTWGDVSTLGPGRNHVVYLYMGPFMGWTHIWIRIWHNSYLLDPDLASIEKK